MANPSYSTYARLPTVSGERLSFIHEDDVWIVDDRRGSSPIARRLTSDGGSTHVRFSPDGSLLAVANETASGKAELYVMRVGADDDGTMTQLTFTGEDCVPVGWCASPSAAMPGGVPNDAHSTGESHWLVFATCAEQPLGATTLFAVCARGAGSGGGDATPLGLGIADALGWLDGSLLVGRHTHDAHIVGEWSGYRGGAFGQLWLEISAHGKDGGASEFVPVAMPAARSDLHCASPFVAQVSFLLCTTFRLMRIQPAI